MRIFFAEDADQEVTDIVNKYICICCSRVRDGYIEPLNSECGHFLCIRCRRTRLLCYSRDPRETCVCGCRIRVKEPDSDELEVMSAIKCLYKSIGTDQLPCNPPVCKNQININDVVCLWNLYDPTTYDLDDHGRTPLHIAVMNDNEGDVINSLNIVDINAKDNTGWTALGKC